MLTSNLHGLEAHFFMKAIFGCARFKAISVLVATSALIFPAAPVQAAFHLWTITEVYSDASGSLQFIELVDNFGFQQSVGGFTYQISDSGNTITHSYTFPNSLPGVPAGA